MDTNTHEFCRASVPEPNARLACRLGGWQRTAFSRFRTLLLGFRRWLGRRRLLLLLNQAPHCVGWLRALADPVLGAFNIKRTVLTSLFWIVRADDLDKFPVAWAAAVGDNDSVVRPVFRPFSA